MRFKPVLWALALNELRGIVVVAGSKSLWLPQVSAHPYITLASLTFAFLPVLYFWRPKHAQILD